MPTDKHDTILRPQIKRITSLAYTLRETSEELYNLCTRRHPELTQAIWLIRQTQKQLNETLKILGEEL